MSNPQEQRRQEWVALLFVCVFVFPALTVGLVGLYGLLVWLLQGLTG